MLGFAKFLGIVGDVEVMLVVAIIMSAILIYAKKQKDALVVLMSFGVSTAATYVLKHIFKIPRPEHMLVAETGYRFPSGHATAAGVVAVLAIYFAHKYLKHNSQRLYRYFVYVLATIWLAVSVWARLYLQVHLPIDVVCGAIVGVFTTIFTIHIFTKHLSYKRGTDFI